MGDSDASEEWTLTYVTRPSLSEYLSREILELVRAESLRPGDRLPSARALAERFSVATPTLREALRRLQAVGVIDIRHGSGVYVRAGHERVVFANPHVGQLEAKTLLQLLDARLLIEPYLAKSAALNAREHDVAALWAALDEAEQHLAGNDADLHRENMGFHRQIATMSSNKILAHVLDSLIDLYSFEQGVILKLFNDRARDHADHREILKSIGERDPTGARRAMKRHLTDVKAVIAGRLKEGESVDIVLNDHLAAHPTA